MVPTFLAIWSLRVEDSQAILYLSAPPLTGLLGLLLYPTTPFYFEVCDIIALRDSTLISPNPQRILIEPGFHLG